MRCPECDRENETGAAFCSNCRALFLSQELSRGDPPTLKEDKESSPVSAIAPRTAPPPPPRVTSESRLSSSAPRTRSATIPPAPPEALRSATPAPETQQGVVTKVLSLDPQMEKGTQVVAMPSSPQAPRAFSSDAKRRPAAMRSSSEGLIKRGLAVEESRLSSSVDEVFSSMGLFYTRLHRLDRYSLCMLIIAVISSFLPWSRIPGEGLQAGIQEYGAVSALLGAMAFASLIHRTLHRRNVALFLFLQVVLCTAMTAVPVYRFLTAADLTFSLGLPLTALAGATAVLFTLLRITRLSA